MMELHLSNIRLLLHHTGELCERLGIHAHIDVDWMAGFTLMSHDLQTIECTRSSSIAFTLKQVFLEINILVKSIDVTQMMMINLPSS